MVVINELSIHLDNFLYNIKGLSEEVNGTRADAESFSKINAELCLCYRRAAVASLLLTADVNEFYRFLELSAQQFYIFLEVTKNTKDPDRYHLTTGRSAPLFDAIICPDLTIAENICNYSVQKFSKGEEYEDDFCYFYFIMQLFFLKKSVQLAQEILDQFLISLSGVASTRFNVCTALLLKDRELFDDAIRELIQSYQDKYIAYRNDGSELLEIVDTEGYIFIEGAALVKLAKIRNIDVEKEYKFIPSFVT